MNILIPLIISTIAGFGTIIGSFLVFIPNINKKSCISLILAFSGTIMILISILDLLPSSVFNLLANFSLIKATLIILISFFLGALLIKLIDRQVVEESSLLRVGILSLVSLILHNFPEGIATFMTSYHNPVLGLKLSMAIMLHNIPEGICIAIPIAKSTGSIKKGIVASSLSSLAEPLGAICAYIFLSKYINDLTISIILIFVAGIMISLSINSIYKEALKLDKKIYFALGVLIAFIFNFISLIFF